MLKRILVPLDGSPRAERALPVAARIARTSGGTVVLLCVASIPAEYAPAMYASYVAQTPFYAQKLLDAETAKARYYLADIAQSEHLAGIKIETEALPGSAAPTILAIASRDDEQLIDLIILYSHGRTSFRRWALGSVAQKVARHSPVPVLILREGSYELEDRLAGATHPLCALVALDGSPLAEAALIPAAKLVTALAAPGQGALHLAQIVTPPTIQSEHDYQQRDCEMREHALRTATTDLSAFADSVRASLAAELGLKVTWSVAVNEDVADSLIRMAELGEDTGTYQVTSCDLIAMTTHGHGGFERRMIGSITEHVLTGTTLPLLIVQPHEQHTPATNEPEQAF